MEIFKHPAAPQIAVWFALAILMAFLWWILNRD